MREELMELEKGINKSYASNGSFFKEIKRTTAVPPLFFYNLHAFLNGQDFYYPSIKERVKNEIYSKKILSSLGIRVPKIYNTEENRIEMEFIEGRHFHDFCKDSESDEIYNLAFQIGKETRAVHRKNYAFLDRKTQNIIVDEDGKIWSIDHEFFSESSPGKIKADIFTFEASLKDFPPEIYEPAIDGFEMGYGEDIFRSHYTDPIIIEALSGLMRIHNYFYSKDIVKNLSEALP